ncbi:DUF3291 domain-containing protein [Aliirhizobium terrae]|uniref:DUF3291 domain-containing protein n=1 Tax=Terrirhizobium terrae TaxID=2926709 RepID=UPI0025759975|nr:DUF3291 domain-containing protein [Rhizobium sp. CC-CFT758]WJH41219.1 DUF3291 domain-containing protein [Rhizobium sp. CC-CFT758]
MTGGAKLAIYNFGLFVAPYESDAVEGFRLREPANFAAAECAEGFLGRAGYGEEAGLESWGEQVFPRFIEGSGFDWAPSSLSLWADLESLMAFSYSGVHADALKHARNWQVERRWPALVLWWTEHRPDWADAVERFERLHDHGPGPAAFHFKDPYGPDGERISIDRARVRELAALNAERQQELLAHVLSVGV